MGDLGTYGGRFFVNNDARKANRTRMLWAESAAFHIQAQYL